MQDQCFFSKPKVVWWKCWDGRMWGLLLLNTWLLEQYVWIKLCFTCCLLVYVFQIIIKWPWYVTRLRNHVQEMMIAVPVLGTILHTAPLTTFWGVANSLQKENNFIDIKWRVQMQKPLSAIWNFVLEWPFLSSLCI